MISDAITFDKCIKIFSAAISFRHPFVRLFSVIETLQKHL